MTDVNSALKFGPEWLRALSGAPGNLAGGESSREWGEGADKSHENSGGMGFGFGGCNNCRGKLGDKNYVMRVGMCQ